MPDILCYGDSNTYGTVPMADLDGPRGRYDRSTRWPCVMAADLGADWHLVEAGHPGRTTVHDDPIEGESRNGMRPLQSILESHQPLDVLVLMLGTNDHKPRFSVGAMDIALGARRLVDTILASGAAKHLLLVCPPPVLERGCLAEIFQGAEARGQGLSERMQAVAASRGIGFFDAGKIIQSDPLDGVHFSAENHVKLGHAIARAIAEGSGA